MSFSRFKLFNLHKSLTILQFRSFSPLLKSPISTLELTDAALKRLAALRHKFPNKTLRIAVEAGGCHGFQYKFSLINSEGEMNSQEDLVFQGDKADDIHVVCDKISWDLMKEAKLDYSEELIGSAFRIIDNPAADSGCGCGVSFDLKSNK